MITFFHTADLHFGVENSQARRARFRIFYRDRWGEVSKTSGPGRSVASGVDENKTT